MTVASTELAPTALYPDLDGKVAVVTGGSRGIGTATAVALGANGVSIAVVGRDQSAIDNAVGAVTARGVKAIGVVADCTMEDQLAALRGAVNEQLGAVDILAVFAGGNGMPVPTSDETSAHWREVVETDLTSTFLTVSAFLPDMLARHSGVIITMASAAARQAAKSSAAYAAAKAGVIAFSRHLAGEYAHEGIRVNCIAPSAIENDRMRSWVPEEQRRALGEAFPLGRLGQPEDVAAAALFLASSASSWITGTTLDVAGGKVML
jgi:3-oxoacyl-[acyl-carrier protein] reductase